VVASDYPPYSIGSGAVLQGILKDNWDLWSARTGITVNLQAIDWAKAQQAVLEGRADVIDMFFLLHSAHRSTTTPSRLHAFKRRCFFTAASAELSTRTRCRALRSALWMATPASRNYKTQCSQSEEVLQFRNAGQRGGAAGNPGFLQRQAADDVSPAQVWHRE
jgi:hypothetical protein